MPANFEFIDYTKDKTITGNSGSHYRGVCLISDLLDVEAYFIRAYDARDMSLQCASVSSNYLNKDFQTGKCEFTANFIPTFKLLNMVPGLPFKRRINYGQWSFTIGGTLNPIGWYWNTVAKANIVPTDFTALISVAVDEIVLFGSRGTYAVTDQPPTDLGTYARYSDEYGNKVNSDTFMGASAGKVMWGGASITPRQLENGNMTDDVEIHLSARAIEWNKQFNQFGGVDDDRWQTVVDDDGLPLYSSTNFSPLLL